MASSDSLSSDFLLESLGSMTHELRFQARFYWCWSCGLVAVGATIVVLGLYADSRVVQTLLGTGGSLVGSVTVFPLATIFATRRKLALLSSYLRELSRPSPAQEAMDAVKDFLGQQLKD